MAPLLRPGKVLASRRRRDCRPGQRHRVVHLGVARDASLGRRRRRRSPPFWSRFRRGDARRRTDSAPDDPTSGAESLTLAGVIVDPATTRYHFNESLAGPAGDESLPSGEYEAATDGSFAIDLVRLQTAGDIGILIVEVPDPPTTTVDDHG